MANVVQMRSLIISSVKSLLCLCQKSMFLISCSFITFWLLSSRVHASTALLSSSHYMSFFQSMRFTVRPLPIHNLAFPFVSVLLICNSITTLHLPSCSKASVTHGSPLAHTQTSRLCAKTSLNNYFILIFTSHHPELSLAPPPPLSHLSCTPYTTSYL